MSVFVPVNSIETRLRAMIQDKNTLSWSFYTPLAAAELWILARNRPEEDGSNDLQNPEVCIFNHPGHSFIGIYTARDRAEAVMAQWQLSEREWIPVSAPGYQLLRYLGENHELWMNAGLKDCQYHLDPEMVEILLSRPEPPVEKATHHVALNADHDPKKFLGPLREFLSRQSTVRAAWVFGQQPDAPLPAGHCAYEVELLMEDPEDQSLLEQVRVMAKALTPVEMEWTVGVMLADDRSLRNLAKQQRPFYAAPDFLKKDA